MPVGIGFADVDLNTVISIETLRNFVNGLVSSAFFGLQRKHFLVMRNQRHRHTGKTRFGALRGLLYPKQRQLQCAGVAVDYFEDNARWRRLKGQHNVQREGRGETGNR